jgi:hypothetical protein
MACFVQPEGQFEAVLSLKSAEIAIIKLRKHNDDWAWVG